MEYYIYHHGVKGQRWGVRNEDDKNLLKSKTKKLNKKELDKKKNTGKKVLIGLGIGTAAAAATVGSAVALKKVGEDLVAAGGLLGMMYAMSVLSG